MDLSPARWIWLPAARTLANTFVLFRRGVRLSESPRSARGWIFADSRYRLTVNGQRVQWGPAPCDPREQEVDPIDLAPFLRAGENVIGVEVLFFGVGDGTWPIGAPGFIFKLDVDGQQIVSDDMWRCCIDRAHPPGMYKRWYLRALQEEFDARLHPHGWDATGFVEDARWMTSRALPGRADRSSAIAGAGNYLLDLYSPRQDYPIVERTIPMMRESIVPAMRLAESGRVAWKRDPRDWFEFRLPDSFAIDPSPVHQVIDGAWTLPAARDANDAVFATFEWTEQGVGWPIVTIDAPAGAIVELMVQEAHDATATHWLDSQFFAWSRFVCREGENTFEPFDFESFRWLQVHVRNHGGRGVTIKAVAMRRRVFPWPNKPTIQCKDDDLQRLFDASVNTLNNSALETCVDGMARERQQYSGDGGHQLRAIRYAFGEQRLPRRFIRTFSMGQGPDGYFLDSWPAYDRLSRLTQRWTGMATWGPLLDHGVGFIFDCYLHYRDTGDVELIREVFPRLHKFANYLNSIVRDEDELLPVEDIGIPAVWIDHEAYTQQRHKQCAFNLYACAMLTHALAPLADAVGDEKSAGAHRRFGEQLLDVITRRFWDATQNLFVVNKPWLAEEKNQSRHCDRSLATAVLFDQFPKDAPRGATINMLETCPPAMGLSYPANAGWRYSALAKAGRADVVWREFRDRWATMQSVRQNNTLQEFWTVRSDSTDQWSHCAVAPLFVLFEDLVGLRATKPGFTEYELCPQLADAPSLDVIAQTPVGPIRVQTAPTNDGCEVRITAARAGDGTVIAHNESGKATATKLKPGEATSIFQHRADRK